MRNKITAINRNFLFHRAYKKGASFVTKLVVVYVVKTRGPLRLGISASKKIGCAVKRNRARRIVKAAAVNLLKDAGGYFDIVVVCRSAAVYAKSTDIETALRPILTKAGVIG